MKGHLLLLVNTKRHVRQECIVLDMKFPACELSRMENRIADRCGKTTIEIEHEFDQFRVKNVKEKRKEDVMGCCYII